MVVDSFRVRIASEKKKKGCKKEQQPKSREKSKKLTGQPLKVVGYENPPGRFYFGIELGGYRSPGGGGTVTAAFTPWPFDLATKWRPGQDVRAAIGRSKRDLVYIPWLGLSFSTFGPFLLDVGSFLLTVAPSF